MSFAEASSIGIFGSAALLIWIAFSIKNQVFRHFSSLLFITGLLLIISGITVTYSLLGSVGVGGYSQTLVGKVFIAVQSIVFLVFIWEFIMLILSVFYALKGKKEVDTSRFDNP